jgi:DNA-binding Lrp family transcriptional regulator
MAKLDQDLLYKITENARIQIKEISNNLKKSSPRLKYNLNIIKKEKIIICPHFLIDYSFLGFLLFKVYFKGGFYSEEENKIIINNLKNNPLVTSIYEIEGKYDFAIEIIAQNPSKFNKELQIISKTLEYNSHSVALNLVSHIYPRNYLINNINIDPIEFIVGGDRKTKEFSQQEISVLKEILKNPILHTTKQSNNANMHIQTFKNNMKHLYKEKIIRSARYEISPKNTPIEKIKLFLKMQSKNRENDEKYFNEFMIKTKEIIAFHKTIGEWDIEIDIEAKNRNEIKSIIRSVREKFKHLIKEIDTVEIINIHKRQYLPDDFNDNLQKK